MKKLWDKGIPLLQEIEEFTVGDDPHLDQNLTTYDCLRSIAHAKTFRALRISTLDEMTATKQW